MLTPAQLARNYRRNVAYLEQKVDGLDHRDSLRQFPGVNCLNWTVGHIVHYRNAILAELDAESVGAPGELARYERESEPIEGDGPGVLSFERLRELLAASQDRLDAALADADEAELTAPIQVGERTTTKAGKLLFWYFHDTLHVGQADAIADLTRATKA